MVSRVHIKAVEALASIDRKEWPELAKKAGVGLSWLRAFGAGKISEPSALKLEKLIYAITGEIVTLKAA